MAIIIEVTESKAYRISIIQMGKNIKGEDKKEKLFSIRQMYKTKKDKDWKFGRQGITIPLPSFAKIIKKCIKLYKNPEAKVEIIEKEK